MKKLLVLAVVVLSSCSGAFAWTLKPVLGYGTLMSPSLPDVSSLGGTMTKGGLNGGVQALWDKGTYSAGIELASIPLYSYNYSLTGLTGFNYQTFQPIYGTVSYNVSATAMPILAVIQYPVGNQSGSFAPYLTGGAGIYMISGAGILSKSDFGICAGAGASLSPAIDAAIKYYYITTSGTACSLFNIAVGYSFKM